MRIGITGHSNLAPDAVPLVADAMREVLAGIERPVIGVTCLARGADQVFARVVLELGGRLEVILPAADYRERKVRPDDREDFEELIGRAHSVRTLPFPESGRAAYEAANEDLLSGSDVLVAAWDGAPSGGRGGTADTVRIARDRGIPVTVVWPAGATRAR